MLIKTTTSGFHHPVPSEITPQGIYQGRRDAEASVIAASELLPALKAKLNA